MPATSCHPCHLPFCTCPPPPIAALEDIDECVTYRVFGARETVTHHYAPVGGVHMTVTRFFDVEWGSAGPPRLKGASTLDALVTALEGPASDGLEVVPHDFEVGADVAQAAYDSEDDDDAGAAGQDLRGDESTHSAALLISRVARGAAAPPAQARASSRPQGVSTQPPVLPPPLGGGASADTRNLTSQLFPL